METTTQGGGGSAKPDAPITFDESDFPSLGGGPAWPAGVAADGGTTGGGPGGGIAGGAPPPITAASATLGPDPYVALSLGKGQEFNMQVRVYEACLDMKSSCPVIMTSLCFCYCFCFCFSSFLPRWTRQNCFELRADDVLRIVGLNELSCHLQPVPMQGWNPCSSGGHQAGLHFCLWPIARRCCKRTLAP